MASVPFDFFGLLILVIVGPIIVALIRIFLILLPAAIVTIMVWFLTESTWWTGVAFVVISALSIMKKL